MKNLIKDSILLLLIVAINIISLGSESKSNIEENIFEQEVIEKIVDCEVEIATAQKDTYSAFQKFINESKVKIVNNENSISELKQNSINLEELEEEEFIVEINDLEESNEILKSQLDDYVRGGNGNWMIFKADFDQNLMILDLAFCEVNDRSIK